MPTCAEFGVIDQYLSLRDQMDSEEPQVLLDLDQKVPQFIGERLSSSPIEPPVTVKSEFPHFLDMDFGGNPYMSFNPTPTTTTAAAHPVTTAAPTVSCTYDATGSRSFVAEAAGSGCTLIEAGRGDQQVGNGYHPDLFDLDSQTRPFYDDNSSSSVKYIKEEPEPFSMESFLIEQIRHEIESDCHELMCSSDPSKWCEEEVQNWVRWMCRKHRYPPCVVEYFKMPGQRLCQMVEEDFMWRSSECGSFLHQQLEVWKMACKLSPPIEPRPADMAQSSPGSLCPAPSISPAPSTCSTMSSSSSGGNYPSDSMDDDVFSVRPFNKPPVNVPHRSAPSGPREHPGPRQPKQTIHLWQFLRELLDDPESYHSCIKWTDRARGVFKIEDSSKVARLWGRRKNRPAMNYDKLSRSVRQYYKKGIIKKTEQSKRLVYQFCQPYL